MGTQEPGGIRGLGSDVRKYAELRAGEIKLRAARTASNVLSRFLSYLLLIIVLGIVLGLASYALLQWLNALLGAPWGTLIALGLFVILFAVLFAKRNTLFRTMFTSLLTDVPSEEIDSAIESFEKKSVEMEYQIGGDVNGIRDSFSPIRAAGSVLKNKKLIINLVSMIVTLVGIFRKGKRKCTNSRQS